MNRTFLDSNIIIYANDRRDRAKQERALAVVKELLTTRTGVVSTQVLQEYAAVALTKLHQSPEVVQRQLRLLESFTVVPVSTSMIRRAVEIFTLFQTSYWDAAIIAAAESAGCDTLCTEDLNPGQFYSGVRIVNPFAA